MKYLPAAARLPGRSVAQGAPKRFGTRCGREVTHRQIVQQAPQHVRAVGLDDADMSVVVLESRREQTGIVFVLTGLAGSEKLNHVTVEHQGILRPFKADRLLEHSKPSSFAAAKRPELPPSNAAIMPQPDSGAL
ncbi:hypothetical protein [Maricaulis sp.]|uniref:hypothetical protein n=1 Tax=Maricaulis sp. TaxID=1486257 RepID=UPI0025B7D14E|nr:hypothetical protein [Maricaulis sp.]